MRVSDGVSGQVYFDGDIADVQLQSLEQFYVPWLVEVWLEGQQVFRHLLDYEGQKVCLYIDGKLLVCIIGSNSRERHRLRLFSYCSTFFPVCIRLIC